ncbi:hypothetical protein, partial [uncultured Oscillibacter sp.]|uniref:hypothetical protein n=1 Tax=uncultured Oscillibacter sp. TaxID=876091 RepID=UPI00261F9A94
YGVRTIGELAAFPRETLEELMGKLGGQIHDYASVSRGNAASSPMVRTPYCPSSFCAAPPT